MRREEETQAALEAALAENKRLRAEIEQLKDALAGHSAPAPESASNDSGAVLCLPKCLRNWRGYNTCGQSGQGGAFPLAVPRA